MPNSIDNEPTRTADEQVVMAIGRGDREAMRELVQRYQGPLWRVAWHTLGDATAAEDVAQDVFLRVFRAASGFDPSGSVANWLYRIALNLCRDRLRRLKRKVVSLEQLDGHPAAREERDPMETEERIRQIRQALDELPERQHTAVILHRYANLSHRQIAEITGWSPSAVESLLVRAYARLRVKLAHLVCPAG
jgi:RNA polymerase sigma-70 factor, ECF subfamily